MKGALQMTPYGDLTGVLAMAIGGYAIAAGIGMGLASDRFARMLDESRDSAALSFAIGILVYSLGIVIVLVHPYEAGWMDVLIAVTGWGMIAEGLIFLAAPQLIWAIAQPFIRPGSWTRIWGVIAALFGVAMIYAGWCHL
jgi:hypothetical protein